MERLTPSASSWEDCDVWRIDLDALAPSEDELRCLQPFEIERARRLLRARDRRRYLAAHWALRKVLSPWLGIHAGALRLRVDAQSKPHLDHGGAPAFNLSHSGGTAVVAVTRLGSVGVDIEMQTELQDVMALARRHLSFVEWQAFEALAETDRTNGFLRAWTRKEAALKALGCGLRIDTAAVDVGLGPEAAAWQAPAEWGGHQVTVFPSLIDGGAHIALARHPGPILAIGTR